MAAWKTKAGVREGERDGGAKVKEIAKHMAHYIAHCGQIRHGYDTNNENVQKPITRSAVKYIQYCFQEN